MNHRPTFDPITFDWIPAKLATDALFADCAALFSNHYGQWGAKGPRPFQNILLVPDKLKQEYLLQNDSWIAIAKDDTQIIGYALTIRLNMDSDKVVTLVTQLVVHKAYRQRGLAKRILNSIWGFSDHFAWGIVTANPFAIRALEKATRRRCDPKIIKKYAAALLKQVEHTIAFLNQKILSVTDEKSVIDTRFYYNNSELPAQLDAATAEQPWLLGELQEGEEWFAFTLQEQMPFQPPFNELNRIFADNDKIVMRAYAGMKEDVHHKWMQATAHEVDVIFQAIQPKPGDTFLDMGCGSGRHAIEIAKRGFRVTGVDFIEAKIEQAKSLAQDIENIRFIVGDCRTLRLKERFNHAICLYDVIGSFANAVENHQIIQTIYTHLEEGGSFFASVMNLELTKKMAKHVAPILQNPDKLLLLPPSQIMQNTGNIFNPDHFLLDPRTNVVYRKEQFDGRWDLPCELIVRDYRYSEKSLDKTCKKAGFKKIMTRYVGLNQWPIALEATDPKAKEVLYLGTKPHPTQPNGKR